MHQNCPISSIVSKQQGGIPVILSDHLGHCIESYLCVSPTQTVHTACTQPEGGKHHFSLQADLETQAAAMQPLSIHKTQQMRVVPVSHIVPPAFPDPLFLFCCADICLALHFPRWPLMGTLLHVLSAVVSTGPVCKAWRARPPAHPWPVVCLVEVVRMFAHLWWRSQVPGEAL